MHVMTTNYIFRECINIIYKCELEVEPVSSDSSSLRVKCLVSETSQYHGKSLYKKLVAGQTPHL